MCGIAAIVVPESEGYAEAVHRMVKALKHRGPDKEGTHFFKSCALGHTRLSVIDLDSGDQPMVSHAKQVGISFNGEIYDYRLLKSSLSDYPFRTSSDTEVILALYHRYGIRCLEYLKGMFAFALWDEEAQELVCARDRFGEKPLFYAVGAHGELIVASEIKAIVASGLIQPILNRVALVHYLQHLCVPTNQTIYSNIQVLPPAHAMRYRQGRLTIERYWCLPEPTTRVMPWQDAVEEFRHLFGKAVERCLVADVPVGLFLSGGLDSSSVVAMASEFAKTLNTFFFDFERASTERGYAREVANKYQTHHIELSDTHVSIADLIIEMQSVFDEPFADSSNIPTWLLARAARQHVKVVLAGDGGDEMLGGYSHWYRALWHMEHTSTPGAAFLQLIAHFAGPYKQSIRAAYADQFRGIEYRQRYRSMGEAHRAQQTYFSFEQLAPMGLIEKHITLGDPKSLDDVFRQDIEGYLPSDILTKVDRASMAHGLEVRSPFLDVDLASFCIALPTRFKLDGQTDKILLRKALAHVWPESIRKRGKQGFGAPVSEWLKRGDVAELKVQYLENHRRKIFSVLPFDQARAFLSRNDYLTWILLVLSVWMEKHDVALAE